MWRRSARGRGLVPGLAYQLGILFASPVNNIEDFLHHRLGYQWALGSFEMANMSQWDIR